MTVLLLTREDIEKEAKLHGAVQACSVCSAFASKGWETFPSTVSDKVLVLLGTTRDVEQEEPTVEEFHEAGTSLWHVEAPIALQFYPYNRCELWQCSNCQKPYLRYTEYGGYYEEMRIRELRPELISPVLP